MAEPRTPAHLRAAGRRLWQSVMRTYELDEHEALLLEQACRTADLVAELDAAVRAVGALTTAEGRIRAEVIELRQQRIVLARLLVALRVPIGDIDADERKHGPPRLQRRSGARGVYALGGAG